MMRSNKKYNVVRLLFSVLICIAAVWSVQTMSSAWMRVRGDRLLKVENRVAAEKWFNAALQIDPQNWRAEYRRGQIYFHYRYYELDPVRKKEWALKEQAAYAAAYRVNHKQPEVVYGLANVEFFLGNRARGLDLLRQVAAHSRFNDFYWRKLGIELRKAGLYDEALNAFEYALTQDRSNATVKRNIEWIKAKLAE